MSFASIGIENDVYYNRRAGFSQQAAAAGICNLWDAGGEIASSQPCPCRVPLGQVNGPGQGGAPRNDLLEKAGARRGGLTRAPGWVYYSRCPARAGEKPTYQEEHAVEKKLNELKARLVEINDLQSACLLYTSPSPRD